MRRGDVLHGPRVDLRPLNGERLGSVARRARPQPRLARAVGAARASRARRIPAPTPTRSRHAAARGSVSGTSTPRTGSGSSCARARSSARSASAASSAGRSSRRTSGTGSTSPPPARATCPKRSPSCSASRSMSSACTASRPRSCPATRASRRVAEKLGLRDEGHVGAVPPDPRRVGGPRALRDHRRGVGDAAARARRCVPGRLNVTGSRGALLTVALPRRAPLSVRARRLHRGFEVGAATASRATSPSWRPTGRAWHLGARRRERRPRRRAARRRRRTPTRARSRRRVARRAARRTGSSRPRPAGPTARSSIQGCPPPGWMPMRANRASKRADSPAMRTSQQSARLKPAPTAGPFTAAIVGSGDVAARGGSRRRSTRTSRGVAGPRVER